MGTLVIVAALLWPIVPIVLLRSHVLDRFTDRLKQDLGESAALLLYIAVVIAAYFAILGAAAWTGVGPQALVAIAISALAVATFRLLNGENVDFD